MSVLLDVSHRRALLSCMPFSMTLRNPLILYSHDSGWMSTSDDIIVQYSTLLISNDPVFVKFWHLLVCISFYYSSHNMIFWTNSDLTKYFPNEKSTTLLFFYAVLQMSFLPPLSSKCIEILIICISQPFLPFMQFWCSSDHSFLVLQF